MRPVSVEMLLESARLTQSAFISVYELDLSPLGGDLLRFYAGLNGLSEPLVWQGNTYAAFPIEGSGFESNGQGTSNRPKLTVANITGLMTGLNQRFDDLVGAVLTRRQMFARDLDAVNFAEGNLNADPTQELVSRYVVERCVSLDSDFAVYELALPSEMDGAVIPARFISTDVCPWQYREDGCGYAGGAVADENDNVTADPAKDKCSRRLSGCKLRFPNQALPFGGFPTASKY